MMHRMFFTRNSARPAYHCTQSTKIGSEGGVASQHPRGKRTDIGTITTHFSAIISLRLNTIGEALLTCYHTCNTTFNRGVVRTHGNLFLLSFDDTMMQ
jgi:hypothetical protein